MLDEHKTEIELLYEHWTNVVRTLAKCCKIIEQMLYKTAVHLIYPYVWPLYILLCMISGKGMPRRKNSVYAFAF
jgi:hypothetical protein